MSNIWYGSINNRIAERSQQPTPVIGMGVTELSYTDCDPWEIIEVKDEKHIVVRELGYERIDKNGMSDCQKYRYFQKPDGNIRHLVLRNGRWRDREWNIEYEKDSEGNYIFDKNYDRIIKSMKPSNRLGCNGWSLGYARKYYDYSF